MASKLPKWVRWYKKPSYVDVKAFATSLNNKVEERETNSSAESISSLRSETSIPNDLTLERILANKTCSPMSLYDFYMYLRHVEFSQENLEFYVWYRDYQKRHQESARKSKDVATVTQPYHIPSIKYTSIVSKGYYDIREKEIWTPIDPNISPEFVNYIESLILYQAARYPKPCCTFGPTTTATTCALPSTSLDPSQTQNELQQIIALFLTPGGPKELNIPPSMRKAVITNLNTSDSPEHFARIADHVYALLKNCSHRNFVRLGVNNGTFETLCMVTFVGITCTILGFLIMLLLAFASPAIHHSSRWRGLAVIPLWFIGISFLLAGMRGSCFLLLLFSRRQELPWERVDGGSDVEAGIGVGVNATKTVSNKRSKNPILRFARKMMIFERKIRVKDMGLRRLQRKIVVQSVVGAVIGTTILEVFFLCLPIWKEKI